MLDKLVIKRALITGPTGAVGTALIDELVAHGTEVTAVAREGSKRLDSIPISENVKIVECDLSNIGSLPQKLENGYDVFFHFAWDGTFGEPRQDWALQESNVKYSLDAVYAAQELGCKAFIGAGSQSEFGHVDGMLHPDMKCRPDNGYGAAKLAACDMTRALCLHLGIRHEWCRIVSLYGPHDNSRSLVMSVISQLREGKRPQCTPCDQIWDYVYSKDSAQAFRLVAERGLDGEVYLIASGQSRPLKDYVLDIRDIVAPGAEIGFGEIPYYQNQVMRLEADINNLVQDTGYCPRYSFKQGIGELVASL